MAEASKTTRRAFLAGRSAAEALADALEGPARLPAPAGAVGVQPGSHLLSVSREAMACLFEIVFDAAESRELTELAVSALDRIGALESQLTIYRETSEVTHINRQAARGPVVVEQLLFELLKRAAALSVATGGAFDITAGRLSKVWGFHRHQGRMPAAEEIATAQSSLGVRGLDFDDDARSVRFLDEKIELNLGAIGKGYAIDQAAATLEAGGVCSFLIHGGNSSVLARGQRLANQELSGSECSEAMDLQKSKLKNQKSKTQPGWSVALRHPLRPDVRLAEFNLRNQALGTSGSGTQFFHYQGRRYGHIIDPRTGWPAEQVLSATVIAPSAEQADALSTAFYVLGVEQAQEYCARHLEISALLCTPTRTGAGIELHPVNLDDGAWQAVSTANV